MKSQSDEFLNAPASNFSCHDHSNGDHVRIHALRNQYGAMVTDARGITRVLDDKAKGELTAGIKNMPTGSWARTKVRILSIRADLSSEREDMSDALWCYQELLDFVKKYPSVFPEAIWQPAILLNLADLSEHMGRVVEAETYYLQALDTSYIRHGRYDNDNVKLLYALADVCKRNGRLSYAAEILSRVLYRREETSGLTDKAALLAMQDLASVHAKLRNLNVAKLLYERVLDGREGGSSLDEQTMLAVMNDLCDVYVRLNLMDEAQQLSLRALPAMRQVYGPDHTLTRSTVAHYLEYTTNFDFDEHVEMVLNHYRQYHTDEGLWVLQGLARAYSLAGLHLDAARTFKLVGDIRKITQGPQAHATLEALQGKALAYEFMDNIDRSISSFTHLLQLSSRTPPEHQARLRTEPTRGRLMALKARKSALEEEKLAWGQQSLGSCFACKQMTQYFCLNCQIYRFCSENCRDRSNTTHKQTCHPSVSLCESKAVSMFEAVPRQITQFAVELIQSRDMRRNVRTRIYRIASTFSFSLDPRKFTTFRVKLSSPVTTFLMF